MTLRFLVMLVVAMQLTTPAGAQTVFVDKSTLGLDSNAPVTPLEIDGDPTTRDFIQLAVRPGRSGDQLLMRGIVVQAGRLCVGEFYDPWEDALPRTQFFFDGILTGGIYAVGNRHKFIAQGAVTYQEFDIARAGQGPRLSPGVFGCKAQ